MKDTFVMHRRVEFIDTDMAGIVHLTAFFRYMETAEHELFRTMGLSVVAKQGDGHVGWPRVSCGFDFMRSLRFAEEFEVHLCVTQIGERSVTYQVEIVRDEAVLARGYSTSACCEIGPGEEMQSATIPSEIVAKLKQYLVRASPQAEKESPDNTEDRD